MLQSRKNKSIVSILQDRELNNKCAPYFLSLNIISQLIRKNNSDVLYKNYWKKTSQKPMTYDCGYLYFSNYTEFCSIFSEYGKSFPMFKVQKSRAKMKVSDVISYSIPVYKNIDNICKCERQACTCLSQCFLSVSEDNWLCQHLMVNGKLIREVYVNCIGQKFQFKYCDWDVYGDRFVLTSTLNPDNKICEKKKTDAVVKLAVFTMFPFEFLALLDIKRSVFGKSCTAANISDQHLILGKGCFQVHIYSFEDFLKQGNLRPYKLGDSYGDGKIGSYPVGLPMNFTYSHAPPLLFNVNCYGQIIRFGGYPYHYITASATNNNEFSVANIESNTPAEGISLLSHTHHDSELFFHPDHSNRLILRTNRKAEFYRLLNENGVSKLSKLYTLGFFEEKPEAPTTSSYGRTLKRRKIDNFDSTIFSTDYASDLDLFGILGIHISSPFEGFVRLYDSVTGEEVRTLKLKDPVCDLHFYQLYIDMGSIIIIERKTNSSSVYNVYVYNL